MTEPSRPRPVPGPPRPGPVGPGTVSPGGATPGAGEARRVVAEGAPGVVPAAGGADAGSPYAGLGARPVAEHVAVFEAEHDRLQRELATIDQL